MKTHKILGFFLIISLCFSSAYMCDDGQEEPNGRPQGQQEGHEGEEDEDDHEHKDGDDHQHHVGCGHGHDHKHDHHH